MSRNETNLTAKQERAIDALLREPTVMSAAEAAGVSKATIFRWLAEPLFSAAYRHARAAIGKHVDSFAERQRRCGDLLA